MELLFIVLEICVYELDCGDLFIAISLRRRVRPRLDILNLTAGIYLSHVLHVEMKKGIVEAWLESKAFFMQL